MRPLLWLPVSTVWLACAAQDAPRFTDNIRLEVAPLSLPGIDFACYDVLIENGDGQTVVALGDPATSLLSATPDANTICSTQYGNGPGGDILYVAPCDASRPNHTVTLWVDGLYTGTPAAPVGVEHQDPCAGGCELSVSCAENADTPVIFNLTIMRPAIQGFFDIAVNFEDIFCSAKFDTCHDDVRHIELLHGADGERDWTGVVGFACTAGAGDVHTNLLYGLVRVDCGPAGIFVLDPKLDAGNASVTVGPNTLHYGIYRGLEDLDCSQGPGSCNKAYWNLAFSIDDLRAMNATCTLVVSATANDGNEGFSDGLPTADGLVYPYVEVATTLTLAAASPATVGTATCQRHALNGPSGVVKTTYKGTVGGVPRPLPMCSQFDGEVSVPGPNPPFISAPQFRDLCNADSTCGPDTCPAGQSCAVSPDGQLELYARDVRYLRRPRALNNIPFPASWDKAKAYFHTKCLTPSVLGSPRSTEPRPAILSTSTSPQSMIHLVDPNCTFDPAAPNACKRVVQIANVGTLDNQGFLGATGPHVAWDHSLWYRVSLDGGQSFIGDPNPLVDPLRTSACRMVEDACPSDFPTTCTSTSGFRRAIQALHTDSNPFPGVKTGPSIDANGMSPAETQLTQLSNGTIVVPVYFPPLDPLTGLPYLTTDYRNDPANPLRTDFFVSAVLLGTWNATYTDVAWTLSGTVALPETLSTRGTTEPTVAELWPIDPAGPPRLLMVTRASNFLAPHIASRAWKSASSDGGLSWSAPTPWCYDDGSCFYAQSGKSNLVRASNGVLYWIGNFGENNPAGNVPRNSLRIGRVDEESLTLVKDSVLQIDEPNTVCDSPDVQIAGFSTYVDPLGYLTLYLNRTDHVYFPLDRVPATWDSRVSWYQIAY